MKTRSFILLVAVFLVMLGFVCGQKWTQYQNNKLENSMSLQYQAMIYDIWQVDEDFVMEYLVETNGWEGLSEMNDNFSYFWSLARPNGCITDMECEEIHKYDGLAE